MFGPFWSTILAHVSAALSHVQTDIRFTGIRILRSFFSVAKCHQYFTLTQSIVLLSHIHLLFYDIIKSGKFVFNDIHKKVKKNKHQKKNVIKSKDLSSSEIEMQHIIHILCECCTHIVRILQEVEFYAGF